MPASPASVITNGMVAITLLPKFDRTQSATPHAIMNKDTMSNKCCHENEMILSFMKKNKNLLHNVVDYKEFIKIPRFRYNKILTTIKPSDIPLSITYMTSCSNFYNLTMSFIFIFMNIARKTSNTVQHHLDCVTGYDLFPVSAFRTYTFLIIQRHTT